MHLRSSNIRGQWRLRVWKAPGLGPTVGWHDAVTKESKFILQISLFFERADGTISAYPKGTVSRQWWGGCSGHWKPQGRDVRLPLEKHEVIGHEDRKQLKGTECRWKVKGLERRALQLQLPKQKEVFSFCSLESSALWGQWDSPVSTNRTPYPRAGEPGANKLSLRKKDCLHY